MASLNPYQDPFLYPQPMQINIRSQPAWPWNVQTHNVNSHPQSVFFEQPQECQTEWNHFDIVSNQVPVQLTGFPLTHPWLLPISPPLPFPLLPLQPLSQTLDTASATRRECLSLASLPSAVIEHMLTFLHQHDHARLCMTAKWMLTLARRQLYRRLTIVDIPGQSTDNPEPVLVPVVNKPRASFHYESLHSRYRYQPSKPTQEMIIPQHRYYYDRYTEQLTLEIKDHWPIFRSSRGKMPVFDELKTPWRRLRKLVIVCNSWEYTSNIWPALTALDCPLIGKRVTHLKLNIEISRGTASVVLPLLKCFTDLSLFEFCNIANNQLWWLNHHDPLKYQRMESIVGYLYSRINPKRVKFKLKEGFTHITREYLRNFCMGGKLVELVHDSGYVWRRYVSDMQWYNNLLKDVIDTSLSKYNAAGVKRPIEDDNDDGENDDGDGDGDGAVKTGKKQKMNAGKWRARMRQKKLLRSQVKPVLDHPLRSISLPLAVLRKDLTIEQLDQLRPCIELLEFINPWPVLRENANNGQSSEAPTLLYLSKWPRLRSLSLASVYPKNVEHIQVFTKHTAPQLQKFSVCMNPLWVKYLSALLVSLTRAIEVQFVAEYEADIKEFCDAFTQAHRTASEAGVTILPMVRNLRIVTYQWVEHGVMQRSQTRLEEVLKDRPKVKLDVRDVRLSARWNKLKAEL
ncbi:hypothetical protein GQ42DRAFT_56852 [Ramicandelaber brevisporus]|nr:hypothetical protein GQ42DRAFT_56852 [Ramicandelaber brevisporus]